MTQTPIKPGGNVITWEILPPDLPLPDDPVDSITQPFLAAALTEALELAGYLTPLTLVATNFGLCAKVNQQVVVKAPDWLYVAGVNENKLDRRSYTPHVEGEVPLVVMEFLSDTDGSEYSFRPSPPHGKWYFYEQVLQIPTYVTFEPLEGLLEGTSINKG
ncbi:Uma2 family endonuclease [Candidatus Cyanaurora vandensis]|uniref:Uma2 family endonuclease n=1 Tax=Candidatus Cyanaurora vandensis TaxID=2714958 RepID=UPI00257E806A|nr:Uma2 family endonuclease [Candidatus Cyanaurora vandensis]